ncbi:MAG TPA: hypothetical protein DCP03_18005 [Polaromonas sp.]|uniref:DUF3667 domain-containing protein n=1 Tax=Polaromonas sp. UBA4122 TaxID=1947074 RepID=UPI000EE57A42|nr:DUF3667 domain-containing protein [Polaromonas sp. UBA4122]HAL39891.1 hypothetical protein [Polaromonas sp.]
MTSLQPDYVDTDESSPDCVNICLNCGAPATGNFCPNCGQETAREPRTFAEFFHGLIAQYVAREGQLWQTLSKLFFAPGALTVEYLAGRRARYLRPFQLYLMASVIVFAAVQFFGLNLGLRLYGDQGVHFLRNSRLIGAEDHSNGLRLMPVQIILDHFDTPGVRRFGAMSLEDRFTFLRARRAQYVSYFVLFLVPILALTLGLFYRNRRRRYAEHLVFGLHCQTFLLFSLLVEAKLPTTLADALSFWVIAYFTIALKRVYGGTWPETLGRGAAILSLYFAIISVANLLLVFALLTL